MKTKFLLPFGLSVLFVCGCVASKESALQRNRRIIHRYFEEWGNHAGLAVADELMTKNLILRNPPAVLHGLEEYKQGMTAFHTAFPHLHFTVEEMVAEGDKVVARWTLRATQSGEYQGRPAAGKTISVTGMSLFRLADGKIQEITVNMDRLGQWQQLGWLPASPPPAK